MSGFASDDVQVPLVSEPCWGDDILEREGRDVEVVRVDVHER
jgi:hypothetical protein